MNSESMKEALKRRKGHGLDLTIIVGKTDDDKGSDKESDLAPEVKDASPNDLGQMDKKDDVIQSAGEHHIDQDKDLIGKAVQAHEASQGEQPTGLAAKVHAAMKSRMKK